jgi:WD40 repeat protein
VKNSKYQIVASLLVIALVLNVLQPAFGDYSEKYLTRALISPDCKYLACAFKSTACHDVLDPPSTQFEHQIQSVFDIDRRTWKILGHIVRQGPFPLDGTGQHLGLVAFSPDSKYLATTSAKTELSLIQRMLGPNVFSVPSVQITTSIWDIGQQKIVNTLSHIENPGCLSSSDWIISMPKYDMENILSLAHHESKIELWNFLSGKHELDFAPVSAGVAQGGGDQIWPDPCSFSPDNAILQANVRHLEPSSKESYMVRLFDTQSGKVIRNLPVKSNLRAFSRDGKILVACSTDISAWDINSGKQIWKNDLGAAGISERDSICTGGNRVLIYFEVCPEVTMKDGRKAMLHDGTHGMQVFDVNTGKLVRNFGTSRDYTREVRLTPDGKKILVFTGKGLSPTIETIDVDSGKIIGHLECPFAAVGSILNDCSPSLK